MVKRKGGMDLGIIKNTHKGNCNTCEKQRMLNKHNQCFWCWDKGLIGVKK